MSAPVASVRIVARPFFAEQPNAAIYLSECCNRVYVGRVFPTHCRTCPKPLAVTEIRSEEELDRLYPA